MRDRDAMTSYIGGTPSVGEVERQTLGNYFHENTFKYRTVGVVFW